MGLGADRITREQLKPKRRTQTMSARNRFRKIPFSNREIGIHNGSASVKMRPKRNDKMNNISNEEIVSLAALQRKIDLDSLDDHVSPSDIAGFKEGLGRLDATGFVLLNVAEKILEGKSYSITSDNPETISRCRSLVKHMGAFVKEISEASGRT
jgi:hypothetical protein